MDGWYRRAVVAVKKRSRRALAARRTAVYGSRMHIPGMIVCLVVVAALVGCDPDGADFEDVKKDQREMFYKLGGLDKLIQQMGTKPAGAPSGIEEARRDYPDKVYTIPT